MAETETPRDLDAAAFTAFGTARDRVSLPAAPFDGTVNMPVMHQAVKSFLANQRQATAYTKTRGLVTGGNQKPWRQKGTGRARQGSTRAPHWPGGGTVFGPHGDRNYSEKLPRQMRALARKSALNARAQEGAVVVVDRFTYEKPKTALLRAVLEKIGVADKKVLLLTNGVNTNAYLSARNLPNVQAMPYSDASTYHVLWSDVVVIEGTAIGQELAPVAEKAKDLKPTRKRVARERTKTAAQAQKTARKAASAKVAHAERKARAAAQPKQKAQAAQAKAARKTSAKKAAAKAPAKKPAAKKPAARKPAPKKKKGK
jgi:large subunit ribosomal protein L4